MIVKVRLACRNVAGRSFYLDIGGPGHSGWLRLMGKDFISELDESESESIRVIPRSALLCGFCFKLLLEF